MEEPTPFYAIVQTRGAPDRVRSDFNDPSPIPQRSKTPLLQ